MDEDQFDKMLAQLRIISLELTILTGQGQKKGPLTDAELEDCRQSVVETEREFLTALRYERISLNG